MKADPDYQPLEEVLKLLNEAIDVCDENNLAAIAIDISEAIAKVKSLQSKFEAQ